MHRIMGDVIAVSESLAEAACYDKHYKVEVQTSWTSYVEDNNARGIEARRSDFNLSLTRDTRETERAKCFRRLRRLICFSFSTRRNSSPWRGEAEGMWKVGG